MEVTATTIPPEYTFRYLPYTELEYLELKSIMSTISTHIPSDKMGWIWSNHNHILKTNEPQPCSCGSASGLWIKAATTIRDFIKRVESTNA